MQEEKVVTLPKTTYNMDKEDIKSIKDYLLGIEIILFCILISILLHS
jgi:hypothetical protein